MELRPSLEQSRCFLCREQTLCCIGVHNNAIKTSQGICEPCTREALAHFIMSKAK